MNFIKVVSTNLVSRVLILVFSFNLQPAFADNKKESRSVNSSYINSQNAPSFIDVFREISLRINAVKDDPFDPEYSKNIKAEIYRKYTGKLIFIPIGDDQSGEQKLSGLSYKINTKKMGKIYPLDYEFAVFSIGYFHNISHNSCGADKYSGYVPGGGNYIQYASSDFAVANVENGSKHSNVSVEISDLPVDVARNLSGNIERYVYYKSIESIDVSRDGTWTNGGSCNSIFNLNRINGIFSYFFRDKISGKNVLSFNTID